MSLFKRIPRLCVILISGLTCSCVDVREEFWLHKNGSAAAEITCRMPRMATLAIGGPEGIRELIQRILAKDKRVDSYEVQVTEEQKHVSLRIHCRVDDVMDLRRLRDSINLHEELPPQARKMVGDFDISLKGMSGLAVTRTVNASDAVPALRWLSKSNMEGHSFVKIVHFPQPVTDHNAHESWDGGRTLMWESSLASAIQGPLVYEFVMPLPIAWVWISAVVISLVFLVLLGFLLTKKRRPDRNKPQQAG